ncbi:MAG: 3-oxoacyl-ACP reductase [Candidatus Entotheonella factor]|uniref:3-oxoacyl-ACP reductase n=1 Tax=Entotheonella factor TaxID=1429438 RepID=W4L7T5_ENTF1|nr:MAG: 3-oxoacyl-ACP reductase [Candidatus Entotheonella factor]
MNTIDLQGRKAVVTGGARGIGHGIAKRLLASGASVCLWDIDSDALSEAVQGLRPHGKVVPVTANVADPASVDAAVQETVSNLGGIDIMINNAGISGPNHTVWEYPVEAWQQVVEINLLGVFYCCRAVVPVMLSQGYGRIVSMASIAGKEGNPNASAYSASKAGVIGLTKSLGKELAEQGILVNCVAPAAVETDIFKQMTPEHVEYMRSKIPMGRFGKIEEVASLVTWLASEACTFSTGGVFDLSGGRATY